MHNPFRQAQFIKSAYQLSELVEDTGHEIAFVGRSNAGKSSAINVLCEQRGLARTSKTPGRTQLINFFSIQEDRRLVDLPGYGFAKVDARLKSHWQQALPAYLAERASLRGIVIVMDIRQGLTAYDQTMLEWCAHYQRPVHIILTKSDKINRGPAAQALQHTRKVMRPLMPEATAQLFSAPGKMGVDELVHHLRHWLRLPEQAS
jgi:GTP-binding protein